jgi:phenylalanyl-tRNA synthetase alpha chain
VTADVHSVAAEALEAIAAAQDLTALDAARARYLGRGDGELTGYRRGLGKIADPDGRRQMGQMVNELVERVTDSADERQRTIEAAARALSLETEGIDLTRPAPALRRGRLNPVTLASIEIRRIFAQLGYDAVEGPEVEYDRYNFTLVNQPPGHPARDSQDTFYIDDSRLLRTHTSPVQIRSMLTHGAPLRVIVPGKTFRRDHDATHLPMFHQVEGLCIDEGIAVSDLKGTLEFFARSFFGPKVALQWRPHHFPFTEPSLELELACVLCGGKGCSLCGQSGWLELLGSGMTHPQVLRNGGIDPGRYTGFAFGMGIERAAMLAWGIPDMRLLYDNDVRFLRPAPPTEAELGERVARSVELS